MDVKSVESMTIRVTTERESDKQVGVSLDVKIGNIAFIKEKKGAFYLKDNDRENEARTDSDFFQYLKKKTNGFDYVYMDVDTGRDFYKKCINEYGYRKG